MYWELRIVYPGIFRYIQAYSQLLRHTQAYWGIFRHIQAHHGDNMEKRRKPLPLKMESQKPSLNLLFKQKLVGLKKRDSLCIILEWKKQFNEKNI